MIRLLVYLDSDGRRVVVAQAADGKICNIPSREILHTAYTARILVLRGRALGLHDRALTLVHLVQSSHSPPP